jgi:hypothetical protein
VRRSAPAGGGGGGGFRSWTSSSSSGGSVMGGGGGAGRPMPAAFGGGDRERQNTRREEESRRAWEERQRVVATERAAKAEADRLARVSDLTNEKEYPSLGGVKPAKKAAAAAPAINYRDVAREAAVRSAAEEAAAAVAAKQREMAAAYAAAASRSASGPAGPRLYRHGSYDDGPVDHDFPDEEGYYPPDGDGGDEYNYPPGGDGEDDCDGDCDCAPAEFNAHLAVNRRRGDKSDW